VHQILDGMGVFGYKAFTSIDGGWGTTDDTHGHLTSRHTRELKNADRIEHRGTGADGSQGTCAGMFCHRRSLAHRVAPHSFACAGRQVRKPSVADVDTLSYQARSTQTTLTAKPRPPQQGGVLHLRLDFGYTFHGSADRAAPMVRFSGGGTMPGTSAGLPGMISV
jgi:hypothetical protein